MSPFDTKRNPTVGGSPRIDPRYGVLHNALNLRRAAAKNPAGLEAYYRKRFMRENNITEAEVDAHEADVEANGSPLYTIPKENVS